MFKGTYTDYLLVFGCNFPSRVLNTRHSFLTPDPEWRNLPLPSGQFRKAYFETLSREKKPHPATIRSTRIYNPSEILWCTRVPIKTGCATSYLVSEHFINTYGYEYGTKL